MHGFEIEYFFGTACHNKNYTVTECELSELIMNYVSTFAKTG